MEYLVIVFLAAFLFGILFGIALFAPLPGD
jgi:hypothetical protein